MMPWILLGLALFLAIVWVWEYLDRKRQDRERE